MNPHSIDERSLSASLAGRNRWAAFFFCAAFLGLLNAAEPVLPPARSSMSAQFEALANSADPAQNPFLSAERAPIFGLKLAALLRDPSVNSSILAEARAEYGAELLNAGRNSEAITQFRKVIELQKQGAGIGGQRDLSLARKKLAVAFLRLAEQENCIDHHTSLSCILPIDPSAAHRFQRGARGALTVLLEQLESSPQDMEARWLLNLAAMTLGEHPASVPKQFLIPASVFASEHDIGRFPDIAGNLGLDVLGNAGGCIAEDFDNDGDLDLALSSMGLRDQLRYFRNNGDGTFTDRTSESGLLGEWGGLNLLQADYDNDGFADILVLRGGWFGKAGKHPKSLLRNRGDGTFENVTEQAGLISLHPTQTAAWLDYNGDGRLDLFIGHETREPGDVHPCQLYRNEGEGRFVEVAESVGLAAVGWVKGVACGDYNNDGRPDLYLSRLGEMNLLYRNDGPNGAGWRFTEVSSQAGVSEPKHSFPTWFFDYDNDGWLDLFVAGYRLSSVGDVASDYLGQEFAGERSKLYRNCGDGSFANVSKETGVDRLLLAMGSNFGDLDNDGWLDFYLGTGEPDLSMLMPNRMFRNAEGKKFQDVTTSGGFGHLQKGHAVAFADFDNDGDQDVYEVLGGAFSADVYRNVLFENPGHGNQWVRIKLEGVKANRAGVGARLRLVLDDGSAERIIYRTVSSGGSFGANPLEQQIGLGKASVIKELTIQWPGSGATQIVRNIPSGALVRVREGEAGFRTERLNPFSLSKQGHPNHHH